ncbi:MAG: N-acetylmuramic acid 6-phosphate etherase [Bacteroidales bacterium]|nr:N-acetylmuramic acid 6-phosphate etherase [Candidatus Cryptobacteroides onthequi]
MLTTEQKSNHAHLDKMSANELLQAINSEDRSVPDAVAKAIPQIEALVNGIVERMHRGGRVFYIGSGTSGRLGVVDASEIPPTYGVRDAFIGIIAGGDGAIRTAVEGAEDDTEQGWKDIEAYNPTKEDTVVGIAASGCTPYVIGGIKAARERGLLTACVTCNAGSPVTEVAEIPCVAVVGPEFVTGSTRMKAGTAQKLILNMISTSVMILMGRVKGCRMVDMELTNKKLVDRGTRMVMDETGITDYDQAKELLMKYGHVRQAVEAYLAQK